MDRRSGPNYGFITPTAPSASDFIAPNEVVSEVVDSPFTMETCPGCCGAVFLRATEDDKIEEVCEVCGPIKWLLSDAPKEKNPPPVARSRAGKAPMPLGMEWLLPETKVEKKVEEKVEEPCSST